VTTGRYGDEPRYSATAPVSWQYPTADTRDIVAFALMTALDAINRSGKGKIGFASQTTGNQAWQMKRNMLSPRYTTHLADIPVIK